MTIGNIRFGLATMQDNVADIADVAQNVIGLQAYNCAIHFWAQQSPGHLSYGQMSALHGHLCLFCGHFYVT